MTLPPPPDPRAYFRSVAPLDYQLPQQALPVVEAVLDASSQDGELRTVLDVGCSYGIGAALLRYRTDVDEMTARYTATAPADATADELIAADAEFFGARRRRRKLTVLGLDAAPEAIDYATRAGLLTAGWAEDLERNEPSPDLSAGIASVGLIVCTGSVGYVDVATFEQLLDTVDDPEDLWVAAFVLRVFDYAAIAELLATYGLITEQVPAVTFPQRRFADAHEQDSAVHAVTERGLDPEGKETDGWFHADCFITRPVAASELMSLPEVVGMAG